MTNPYRIGIATLLSLSINTAYAYNSKQSGGHCEKPIFSEYQPAINKYTQSFTEFSFVASSNTTPTSINVNISAGNLKYHFAPKDLEITSRKSGQLEIRGKLPRPFEHGFARVSITAHSKPNCEHSDGYLVRVY